MRETKFRAKSGGDWVYGSYVKTAVGIHYIIPQNLISNDLPNYVVDKEAVGQNTGLKDKNGREIYEGDVVEGKSTASEGGFNFKGQVIFYEQNNVHGWHVEDEDGGAWEMKQLATRISLDHINGEVIGNIHDNPELLEVSL